MESILAQQTSGDRPALPSPAADGVVFLIEPATTGLTTAMARAPKIRVDTVELAAPLLKVASLPGRMPAVKVQSFTFPEAPAWLQAAKSQADAKNAPPKPVAEPSADAATPRKTVTRIKPPGDTIKLVDRLYYMLQPSLESLLDGGSLRLPFHPFPYQLEGIAFLYPRHGAILADEMGLGKTMQAISTIRLLLHATEVRSVLLICPKPLVTNWRREFAQWAPEIPLTIIEGDQATRHWKWKLSDAPVKIANYELLMRDRDLITDPANKVDLVVLDEAQRIKNQNSTTSEIVRALPRTRGWALTGTPVENRTDDLIGIFEFLSPGYLTTSMNARQMGQAAADYLLRRTKEMVKIDLPPKLFRDAQLGLTPAQQESYQRAEEEGVIGLNELGEEITVQHVFELVLRLKQICNFDPVTGESAKLDRIEADLEEVAASGRKAIIFSQWVKTLDQMKERLAPYNPLEYHGQIPSAKRDPILAEFKENPKRHVLMMSYGAGAVGLNLQFCGYVFLFDRWWNPAVEDQAINRAHRIGATGPVTVTRFITLETIEERIDKVLSEKRQLLDTVFSEAGTPEGIGLTQSEIFGLFDLRSPKGRIRAA